MTESKVMFRQTMERQPLKTRLQPTEVQPASKSPKIATKIFLSENDNRIAFISIEIYTNFSYIQ